LVEDTVHFLLKGKVGSKRDPPSMGSVILQFNMTLTKKRRFCMFSKYKSIIILLLLATNVQAQSKQHKQVKQPIHKMSGTASWYSYQKGNRSHKTASGEIFNPKKMTAAHKTLPFGTKVKVTNLDNKQSVVVTINDRGPFVRGRIIDLSKNAAHKIGITGTQKVAMKVIS
jgi:rare lipoprotein A